MKAGWTLLESELPPLYNLVYIETDKGNIYTVWRANTGEEDIYTEDQSDLIITEKIVKWLKVYK